MKWLDFEIKKAKVTVTPESQMVKRALLEAFANMSPECMDVF